MPLPDRIGPSLFAIAVAACVGQGPGDRAGAPDGGAAGRADAAPSGADAAPDASVLELPRNPVGIGLVSPGDAAQWDRAAELAGRHGHIKLIFPGVDLATQAAPADWIAAVAGSYARDLVPVIRIGPHWGNRNIRQMSDDAAHRRYTELAARYAAVVADLPLRDGWPLVIEIHNEANLCYEWECLPEQAPPHPDAPAGWIHYTDTAAEYASFLRDVTAALRALGDPRIQIINGGLAPGGTVACECGGDGFTPGVTSREFLAAMETAVPGVHAALDGFASHPYPAQGEGWGFFEPYDQSGPGLAYWKTELQTLGIDKPVYITETGWTTAAGASGSREQIADWTVSAWRNDWLAEPRIRAVMPFILQDASWDPFAWVSPSGAPYPVFEAVKAWRCGEGLGGGAGC
jgi:hypothetical protein